MKKLASILVAGLMAVMFASCSAGDGSSVISIEDTPETVDNTKVFMFTFVAEHEKVSGAYAIKIKTVKGVKYCALPPGLVTKRSSRWTKIQTYRDLCMKHMLPIYQWATA